MLPKDSKSNNKTDNTMILNSVQTGNKLKTQ